MLADPLTKSMISPMLYDLITHGYWRMNITGPNGQEQKPLIAIQNKTTFDYSEDDLMNMGKDRIAAKKRYGNNLVSMTPLHPGTTTTSSHTPKRDEICDLGSGQLGSILNHRARPSAIFLMATSPDDSFQTATDDAEDQRHLQGEAVPHYTHGMVMMSKNKFKTKTKPKNGKTPRHILQGEGVDATDIILQGMYLTRTRSSALRAPW